ncbi:Uncharacterised protein [Acinetobacter baumannii]|nr:Uncharacterised protein [Acinetobacter baumannii]
MAPKSAKCLDKSLAAAVAISSVELLALSPYCFLNTLVVWKRPIAPVGLLAPASAPDS